MSKWGRKIKPGLRCTARKRIWQCGLLQDSREGQWVYYQISSKLPDWTDPLLRNALAAIELTDSFKRDLERLQQMDNRPDTLMCC